MPKRKNIDDFFVLVKDRKYQKLLDSINNPTRTKPLNLNQTDQDGKTLLHHIAADMATENFQELAVLIKTLIDGGAKPDIVSKKGTIPIHHAIIHGCVSIFKLLLPASNLDFVTADSGEFPHRWSLLHYAVNNYHPGIFSSLLAAVEPKLLYATNENGQTPVALA